MRPFWRKKSRWERTIEPFAKHVNGGAATRSGLTAAIGFVSLTAVSAVASALRRREDS